MSNVATMKTTDDSFMALEDADVERPTTGAEDYDLARDEIYETDLLDEDSDLDQERLPTDDVENDPVRGGGGGSG